jgi:putative ABC transport system permease protein
MADVWCYFKGITQDEIDSLFSSNSVREVEGRYACIANVNANGSESELIIRSLTGINQSLLSGGTMPENENEIIINNKYASANNLSIGDRLPVETENGIKYLFITGFCYNPEAVVIRKNDAGTVAVGALGFAYGTNSTLIELNRTSPVFVSMLQSINDELEDGRKRLNDADRQIMDAYAEYQKSKREAETELADAQKKLTDSDQQIQEGLQTLITEKNNLTKQFDNFRTKLDGAQKELDEAKKQAATEFAEGKKALDDAKEEIAKNQAEFEKQRADANIQIADAEALIQDGAAKLEESRQQGEAELADAQTQLDEGRDAIDAERAEFERQKSDGEAQLAEAADQIAGARLQLEEKQRQAETELAQAQAQLDEGKKGIDSGEAALNQAMKETDALREQLDEAALQIALSERQLNESYASYQTIRPTLTTLKRKEEDAKFTALFAAMDQQKKEFSSKRSEAEKQIISNESLLAAKITELNAVKEQYEEGVQELVTKRADAMALLNEAKTEIDNKQNELDTKWEEAQIQLDEAEEKLSEAESEYADALNEFNEKKEDAETQWQKAQDELEAKRKELDDKREEARQKLKDAETQLTEANTAYADKLLEWNQKKSDTDRQFLEAQAEIEKQRAELDAQWQEGQKTVAEMEAEIADAQKAYEDGLNEFTEKKTDAETQIGEVENEISDKSQSIQEEKEKFAESEADAKSLLETTAASYQEVLLLTSNPGEAEELAKTNENFVAAIERKDHISYMAVEASIDPIRSLSIFFPVVFFFVAAVVAFISVSKMVDAQRVQIAVMRALGIPEWKIQAHFMIYALAAAMLGAIAFAVLGNIMLPRYLIGVFATELDVPQINAPIYISNIIIAFPAAFLFTGSAVILAMRKVLSINPAQGMRPFAPKKVKTILIERIKPIWRRLDAIGKMVVRGIFRNKARILLSSIGVTGSVALLVAGFSMRSIAIKVLDSTVNSLRYDLVVEYQYPLEDKNDLNIPADVDNAEWTDTQQATIHIGDGISMRIQILENTSRMMRLFDTSENEILIENDSFIIPQTLAADYNLEIGDPLSVNINDQDYTFAITDINEQVFAKKLFVSMGAARKAGLEMRKSVVMVKLRESNYTERIAQELRENDEDISSVSTQQNQIDYANDVMAMLNALIVIIVLASSILSVAVVYNIAAVNILDRSRDYAMVMAMGYTVKQVNGMIVSENTFMTAFGAILGTPLGYLMYQYMCDAVSRDNLTLGRYLNPLAALCAILVSFILMMLTNCLLRGKIYKISLMETLKSVE